MRQGWIMPKRFVIACGGTGGHAFPGIAVAKILRGRGHEVEVWDAGREVEGAVMMDWDGTLFTTKAKPLSLLKIFANMNSFLRCRRRMKKFKPDAILAMGSYSSLPPVMAARSMRVPVLLHEANSVPGKAVSFLSRFAVKTAVSFEDTAKFLPKAETVLTGLPAREEILEAKPFDFIADKAFTVLITGGSQGAHKINELAVAANEMLARDLRRICDRPLQIIHQTGLADESFVMQSYASCSIPARVKAFEREMGSAFASADIVVARAGASTCFELALAGKPALLIPLPGSVRDHQHFNAQAFVSKGAADEATQGELSARALANYLLNRAMKPETLEKMSENMRKIGETLVKGAAGRVADLLEGIAE